MPKVRVPVREHRLNQNEREIFRHYRVQKKWLKRYGTKVEDRQKIDHYLWVLDYQGRETLTESVLFWGLWFGRDRPIWKTATPKGEVSTVFVGAGIPAYAYLMTWESAIIDRGVIRIVERYVTKSEAEAGHKRLVRELSI